MPRIDLTRYDLTTPEVHPDPDRDTAWTLPGHEWEKVRAFVECGENEMLLRAPTTGATTESVKRTRCELKGKPFSLHSKRRFCARITAQVTKVNWKGSFVLIQAHCHDGNDPTFKGFIETTDKKTAVFKGGLRTGDSTASPPKTMIHDNLLLSEPFTATIVLGPASAIAVTMSQGDSSKTLTGKLSNTRAHRAHVFHMGIYNQVDKGAAEEPEDDGTHLKVLELQEWVEEL
ncbi:MULTISPECIES: polysaccharide lyase family 7 protein [Pseudomonas]|uniref:Polysaccharide lyase family 7 protein n=1 Tax=Pseudomonas quercus TaxID=2722792 RepID=A0ABX0YE75_9PSED|nr:MULTISPECIES: polysaccharide lyase family 7 protein [Pseudomonas]MBF7143406.1 polysaccharide lyase family 7 protein [Pseudomonas sp. LY10J]NJP01710.1 polysaccharide lyase family 7 protein [Pseudomonas quercus]